MSWCAICLNELEAGGQHKTVPLTLNYKPTRGGQRIDVTPVALHWAGDSMPVQTVCNHIFCNTCITQWKKDNISCPLCRTQIQPLEYVPPYDAIYIRDIERIQKIYETNSQKASILYTEYMKWLSGTRYSRPVI